MVLDGATRFGLCGMVRECARSCCEVLGGVCDFVEICEMVQIGDGGTGLFDVGGYLTR